VLEQLLGSQSLAGTFAWLIELRYMHVVGIAMIGIWVLSPLGGQSALRLVSIEDTEIRSNQTVSYAMLNTNNGSWLQGTDAMESQPAMTAYYSAALLGADRNSDEPTDIWGNPKVPLMESISYAGDGWTSVANNFSTLYSSLIGVRLQGLCKDCNMDFSIESSYTNLNCHNVAHQIPINETMAYLGTPYHGWLPATPTTPFSGLSLQVNANMSISSFLGTNHIFAGPPTPEEVSTILYVATGLYANKRAASVYNCTMETSRVESQVYCAQGSCRITRMRPSRIDTRPRNWTLFHNNSLELLRLLPFFSFAAGYTYWAQASPTDNFLFGDVAPFNFTEQHDWNKVAEQDISRRLTRAFNALRQVTMAPYSITNGNTFMALQCGPNTPMSSLRDVVADCGNMNFTIAAVSRNAPVYKASRTWIGLLLLTSVVMLLLGVLTIVLHFVTSVPDVLGFVSSLTRDNPYVNIPPGGSTLDGAMRARALRDLKVRLEDVRPHNEVGYFALRSVVENEQVSLVRGKGRSYE
jgi:hypothetical protein